MNQKIILLARATQQFRRKAAVAIFGYSVAALSTFAADSTGRSSPAAGSGTSRESGVSSAVKESEEVSRQDRTFVRKAVEIGLAEVAMARLAISQAQDPQVVSFAQTMLQDHQTANNQLTTIAVRRSIDLPIYPASRSAGESAGASGSTDGGTSRAVPGASGGTNTSGSGSAPGTSGSEAGAPGATSDPPTSASGGAPSGPSIVGGTDTGASAGAPGLSGRHQRKLDQLAKKSGAEFDAAYVRGMVEDHRETIELFQNAARDADDAELKQFATSQLPILQQHLQHAESLASTLGATNPPGGSRSEAGGG